MTKKFDVRERKQIYRTFAELLIDDMIDAFARAAKAEDKVPISLRMRHHGNLRNSWGGCGNGGAFVSLCVRAHEFEYVTNYTEYGHVMTDPEIGEMNHVSYIKYVAALIAHEVAHAFQHSVVWSDFTTEPNIRSALGSHYREAHTGEMLLPHLAKGHDGIWQTFYRFLRINFINNDYFAKHFNQAVETHTAKMTKKKIKLNGEVEIVGYHVYNGGTTYYRRMAASSGRYPLVRAFVLDGDLGKNRKVVGSQGTIVVLMGGKKTKVTCSEHSVKYLP